MIFFNWMITASMLWTTLAVPVHQDDRIRAVGIAMKAGSAKELVKFCNETVEIKIDEESASYSKNQAEVVLRSFFQKYPAKDFSYIHQGESSEQLRYTIGRYTYEGGGVLRVVMLIKKVGDVYVLDTLNFSEE